MKSKELKVLLPILVFLLLISHPVSVQGFDTLCVMDKSNDVMKGYEQNNQLVALYTVSFPALDILKILVEWENENTIKISMLFAGEPIVNASSYYYVYVEGYTSNYSSISIELMFNSMGLDTNDTMGLLLWSGTPSNGLYNLNISTHVGSNSVFWEFSLPDPFPINDFKSIDDPIIDGLAAIGHYYNDSTVFYWDDTEDATSCDSTQDQNDENTNDENNGPEDNVSDLENLPLGWESAFLAVISAGLIYKVRENYKRK